MTNSAWLSAAIVTHGYLVLYFYFRNVLLCGRINDNGIVLSVKVRKKILQMKISFKRSPRHSWFFFKGWQRYWPLFFKLPTFKPNPNFHTSLYDKVARLASYASDGKWQICNNSKLLGSVLRSKFLMHPLLRERSIHGVEFKKYRKKHI